MFIEEIKRQVSLFNLDVSETRGLVNPEALSDSTYCLLVFFSFFC